MHIVAVFGYDLSKSAGAASNLPTTTFLELDVVNHATQRNVLQRNSIANGYFSFRTAHELGAHFQSFRSDDIALFAIHIVQERNAGCAIRIIFNACHFGRNPDLITLEINDAIVLTMSATTMTASDAATIVASAGLGFGFEKRL